MSKSLELPQDHPKVCPVDHQKKVCPVKHDQNTNTEPPDTPDHWINQMNTSHTNTKVIKSDPNNNNPYDNVPGIEIPLTGR